MNKKITNVTKRTLTLVDYTIEPLKSILIPFRKLTTELQTQIKLYKDVNYITVFDVEDEAPIRPHRQVVKEEPQEESVEEIKESPMEEVFEEVINEIVEDKQGEKVEEVKEEKETTKKTTRKKSTKKTIKTEETSKEETE